MTFTRRNLPHLHFPSGAYFVTSCLHNSLPVPFSSLINNLSGNNNDDIILELKIYDNILDSGKFGNQHLSNQEIVEVVKHCIQYADKKEYDLIAYSIMPNHFHLLFDLIKGNKGLSKIMQSIKGISARRSNLILNRTGTFWQDESYDRLVRDQKEFLAVLRYIMYNPVKAGLVENPFDWEHSYCHPDYIEFIS